MKKLILAVLMSLAVADRIKEAGAAACCCSLRMGEGVAEGNQGSVSGETDCVRLGEMADQEGTKGPRDPGVPEDSVATGGHSRSH